MRCLGLLLVTAVAFADIRDAAKTLEQATAALPAPIRQSYLLDGAGSARRIAPEVARRLIDLTLAQIRESRTASPDVMQKLAKAAPDEVAAVYSLLDPFSQSAVLLQSGAILREFGTEHASAAAAFRRALVAGFPYHSFTPAQAFALLSLMPPAPAEARKRIAEGASAPGFGKDIEHNITYTFEAGGKSVTTTDPREMVLTLANAAGPVTIKPPRRTATGAAQTTSIVPRLRAASSDAERAKLAIDAAGRIRALPAGGSKSGAARSLANLVTEGDLGTEALTAVARTLAESLRETPAEEGAYIQLASLIRYEHVDVPDPEPAVRAADALLALREEVHRQSGFALTGLDGKQYTPGLLRGKVVLLNFWATWCPPCRKELPDLEKLHREYAGRGLVILAASDEDRETVAKFAAEQRYTFAIVLDPGRKTHEAFDIQGIPNTFLFDREGRLAAQAIDMRTERQFREMLRRAGVE